MEEGHFKKLEVYVGREVDEDQMLQNDFIHYVFGKDISAEVDMLTGKKEDFGTDEDESGAIREFFGEDCWMKYVPMSDRELKANRIADASFLLGLTINQDEIITSVKEYIRIGVPFAGEIPLISGMPVPMYYDYMPINYCPRYVAKEMEKIILLPES